LILNIIKEWCYINIIKEWSYIKKISKKKNFFEKKSKSQRGGAPPFCPISQEPDFSQTCGFHQKLVNIMLYHLKAFPEKSNVTILSPFGGHLRHICPISRRTRFFLENRALFPDCINALYHPSKFQKKLMTQSWDIECTYVRTFGRDWIHMTFTQAWVQKSLGRSEWVHAMYVHVCQKSVTNLLTN